MLVKYSGSLWCLRGVPYRRFRSWTPLGFAERLLGEDEEDATPQPHAYATCRGTTQTGSKIRNICFMSARVKGHHDSSVTVVQVCVFPGRPWTMNVSGIKDVRDGQAQ